jgi:hypothetical protein
MTTIDSINYPEIKEGNRLPFKEGLFSMEAFRKREAVLEDGLGKRFSFGAHYHGYGKGVVKGGNLCFQVKTVDGKEMVELDFKVNYVFRKALALQKIQEVKTPCKILVGLDADIVGLYTRVKVHFPLTTRLSQLQEMLASVGLSDVLHTSSLEDIERMKIGFLFRLFFPREATVFERTEKFYSLSVADLKAYITCQVPQMQDIFERYLPKMQKYKPLKGRVRYKVEGLGKECVDLGARALITSLALRGHSLSQVVSILKMGFLSSEMRQSSMIDIPGDSWELKVGSFDSVFTQLVTPYHYQENWFSALGYYDHCPITFLLDINLLETVTYQYPEDRGGTRRTGQGAESYLQRPSLHEFVKNQVACPTDSNEVMIKDRVPPSAIRQIYVCDNQAKEDLIHHLRIAGLIEKKGEIETIFNRPVNEFIKLKVVFPLQFSVFESAAPRLGGTHGAEMIEAWQGRRFVRKRVGSIVPEHLVTEYLTNKAYQVLGVVVPPVALYNSSSLLVKEKIPSGATVQEVSFMLSAFVSGIEVGRYLNRDDPSYPERLKEVQELAKKGFVADCLLGNWDVVGSSFDNMLIDPEAKVLWRVDQGSGMDFRAQGRRKGPESFTPHIQEFQTLRDPRINPSAALIFAKVTDEEIIRQIDAILPKKELFLGTIPDRLKEIMENRFESLKVYREELLKRNGHRLA